MGNLSLSCFLQSGCGIFCLPDRKNIRKMKSSNIGGQAVMEGIMMRHKDKYSIAVRRPDNEIELKVEDYKCIFGNAKFLEISADPRCGQLRGFSGGRYKVPDVFRRDCGR